MHSKKHFDNTFYCLLIILSIVFWLIFENNKVFIIEIISKKKETRILNLSEHYDKYKNKKIHLWWLNLKIHILNAWNNNQNQKHNDQSSNKLLFRRIVNS